jgi:DNA repair exonuclease SbcCD ATPase subunit
MDTAIQKLKAGSNANTYQGLISSAYEAKDACEQLIATQKRILEGTEYAPPSVDTWTAAYDNMSQAAEEYIAATESASQRAEAVEQERLESESVAAELEAQIAAKRESYAQQQVANEQIITEAVESSQARHAEVMEAVAESEQQSYAERQAGIQNLATTISNLAAKEAEQQRQDDATIAQAEANEKAITALQARISSALSVVTSKSPEARTELEGISTELEKMKADVFSVDSSKLESMAQTVGTLASQFEGVALPAEQARGKIEEVEMYYSKLKTRINTLDFNMLTDNDTDIKSKLESILQQFSKLEVQMDGLNASGDRVTQEQIDNILAAEVALKGLLDTTTNLRKENDLASKNSVSEVLSNYSKLSSQFKKFSFESLSASSDEAKSNLEALRGKMQELDSAVKSIKVNADSATDEQIQKVKELESEAAELVDKCRQSEQELKNAPKTINSLLASSETMLNSTNEKYAEQRNAIIEARVELEKMKNSTETVDVAKLKELEKVILNNGEALREAGAYSKTFGDSLKTSVTKVLELVGGYRLLMSGVRVLREAVDIVVDVDDAMTELKKVTDETTVAYDNFLDSATERAVTYGSTLSDIVSATADFARLGYDMADASEMANAAIVYQNVGDDIDSIDDASESLISTMQAFGLEASDVMSIVDKFNAIGNSFAISSGGAGEALLRSAAAMEAAGNTLDQTLALAAAANTIVQDPEKVGTTLKTLSMYLRAAKTEAEEAGIETDGMAESVSELRDEILALTGNQVDIQIDED